MQDEQSQGRERASKPYHIHTSARQNLTDLLTRGSPHVGDATIAQSKEPTTRERETLLIPDRTIRPDLRVPHHEQ